MLPDLNLSKSHWRLIYSPAASGVWNMAVDEAILEAVGRGVALPTLRLYAWQPPCLSLGYAQPFSDVDLERLRSRGWELVRRPTGGRAILHTDELTYSIIAPPDEPRLAGGVLGSYQRLSQALLLALQSLSLPAQANEVSTAGSQPASQGPVCFEVPSDYEILVAGKKLVGSAQARRKESVLQHGSLPLFGDIARITQVLSFPDEDQRLSAAERVRSRATTVENVLGYRLAWETVARALADAAQAALNLEFRLEELSADEKSRAEELAREKYGNSIWNARV